MIFSLALVIVLLSWYVPIWMQAAASDLDPAFGNGGIVITDFFGSDDIAYPASRTAGWWRQALPTVALAAMTLPWLDIIVMAASTHRSAQTAL